MLDPVRWWRALQFLEALPVVEDGLFQFSTYWGIDRDPESSFKNHADELCQAVGSEQYDEIMSRPIPEVIIALLIRMADEGYDVHSALLYISEEIDAGTVRWSQELRRIGVKHPDYWRAHAAAKAEVVARYEPYLFAYAEYCKCPYAHDQKQKGWGMIQVEWEIVVGVERGIEGRMARILLHCWVFSERRSKPTIFSRTWKSAVLIAARDVSSLARLPICAFKRPSSGSCKASHRNWYQAAPFTILRRSIWRFSTVFIRGGTACRSSPRMFLNRSSPVLQAQARPLPKVRPWWGYWEKWLNVHIQRITRDAERKCPMNESRAVPDDASAFDGLLLVAAGTNANNRQQVQINVICRGLTWSILTCGAQEARTWLGEDAERLVRWDPTFIEDDGLSGLYRKASFQIPAWIVHWDEIKDLDTVKDRKKLDAIVGGTSPDGADSVKEDTGGKAQ